MFSIESGSTKVRGHDEAEISVSLTYEPKPSARFDVRLYDLRGFSQTKEVTIKSNTLKPGQAGFVSSLKLLLRSDINRDFHAELRQFLAELGIDVQSKRLSGNDRNGERAIQRN